MSAAHFGISLAIIAAFLLVILASYLHAKDETERRVELSPSPEIRYQLRNWHHVTCAGFGGQACTCLAQREALIAELAVKV